MSIDVHWFIDIITIIAAITFAAIRVRMEGKKVKEEIGQVIDARWKSLNEALEKRIKELEGQLTQKIADGIGREARIVELEQKVSVQGKQIELLVIENEKKEKDLVASRLLITELEIKVIKMQTQLELVKKKTGPLGDS